jgi:hypothetical protein
MIRFGSKTFFVMGESGRLPDKLQDRLFIFSLGKMSFMVRTLLVILIPLTLLLGAAVYIGMRSGKALGKRLQSSKTVGHPPNEYLDLFIDRDVNSLMHMNTNLSINRSPISKYRYRGAYEILETRLTVSDTGRLGERIGIVRGGIRPIGFSEWYDVIDLGRIQVDFEYFDQPDSSYKNIVLTIEGEGKTTLINDTVLCYLLKKGYFSISRSRGAPCVLFSDERDGYGGPGRRASTALLFKRRGNFVYIFIASPSRQGEEIPERILADLVGQN